MANAILCQQFGVVIRGVSLSRYSNDLRVTTTRCRYKGRELQWGKSVSAGRCRYKGGVVIWGVVIWVCVLYVYSTGAGADPIIRDFDYKRFQINVHNVPAGALCVDGFP